MAAMRARWFAISLLFFSNLSRADDLEDVLLRYGVSSAVIQEIRSKKSVSAEKADQICAWLENAGIEDVETFLLGFPQVLTLDSEQNLDIKVQWLEAQGVKKTGEFLSSVPNVLGLSIRILDLKVAWLKKLGVQDVGKVISTAPQILTRSILDALDPRVRWLRQQGVQDIGKAIERFPQIFGFSEQTLNLKVKWLKDQGVDTGKVLSKFPGVLGYGIEETFNPTKKWLLTQGIQNVGKFITQFPQIFCLDEETLNFKVEWLTAQGIQDTAKFLSTFPAILSYSIDSNLIPTLEVLRTKFGFSTAEIEEFPSLLGASLKRLTPLFEWTEMAGLAVGNLNKAQRQQIVRSSSVEGAIHNLRLLLDDVRVAIPDDAERLRHLEAGLDRLESAGLSHVLLRNYGKNKVSKRAFSKCVDTVLLMGS